MAPPHSEAWAVGAADQSSVAGWALQSSVTRQEHARTSLDRVVHIPEPEQSRTRTGRRGRRQGEGKRVKRRGRERSHQRILLWLQQQVWQQQQQQKLQTQSFNVNTHHHAITNTAVGLDDQGQMWVVRLSCYITGANQCRLQIVVLWFKVLHMINSTPGGTHYGLSLWSSIHPTAHTLPPAGNCWMGTEGTATPSDQSATSGWVNSAAGAVHSPWNSSFPTAFSAAACSSFSICQDDNQGNTSTSCASGRTSCVVPITVCACVSHLLRVSVEVQVRHDLPGVFP